MSLNPKLPYYRTEYIILYQLVWIAKLYLLNMIFDLIQLSYDGLAISINGIKLVLVLCLQRIPDTFLVRKRQSGKGMQYLIGMICSHL